MAHKKGGGSSKNGRDSNAQRLGVKKFGGGIRHCGNHTCQAARYKDTSGRPCRMRQGLYLFARMTGKVLYHFKKGRSAYP